METSRLEELMEKSIEASNRTTHAVRAFVRFALIEITATILGVAVGGLVGGIAGEVSAGIFVGAIVILVGGIYGLTVGWDELKKSAGDEEVAVTKHVDPATNCKFCGANLHMFSTKCPNCKKRVGL